MIGLYVLFVFIYVVGAWRYYDVVYVAYGALVRKIDMFLLLEDYGSLYMRKECANHDGIRLRG